MIIHPLFRTLDLTVSTVNTSFDRHSDTALSKHTFASPSSANEPILNLYVFIIYCSQTAPVRLNLQPRSIRYRPTNSLSTPTLT